MRLGHLELFVADPLGSIPFYRDALGFDLEAVQHDRFVWFRSGDAMLLLRPGRNAIERETYQGAPMAMVLYTDQLDMARARLVRHGVEIRGDDGPGCLTFCDPDGHWFQLVEQH
jgi:catechol 2,3-dioxygenase-like lactoylglutathione lyase family enzyme